LPDPPYLSGFFVARAQRAFSFLNMLKARIELAAAVIALIAAIVELVSKFI
jgi:hypothetical protein